MWAKITTALEKDARVAAKGLSDLAKGCAILVVIGAAFALGYACLQVVAPYVAPDSVWAYTLHYQTTKENVYIQPKPHDCDYDKAPLEPQQVSGRVH